MRTSLLLGVTLLAAVAMGTAEAVPQAEVISPNGGEVWCAGSTQLIKWSSTLAASRKVTIELSRNGGSTWETLATNEPNDGEFPWTVTLDGGGQGTTNALVRVTVRNSITQTFSDTSDAKFTIEKPLFSAPPETFTFPNTLSDASFTLGLVVCKVGPEDPPAAQKFKYKYIYTMTTTDTNKNFPNTYIREFAASNCKVEYLALTPKKEDGSEDTTWKAIPWQSPGKDEVIWGTNNARSYGISPDNNKRLLIFCVYTNQKWVRSKVSSSGLHIRSLYQSGVTVTGSWEYWTPGCKEEDPGDDPGDDPGGDGCVHEFNLAQVYPVDSYATLPGFPVMGCWKGGDTPEPIQPEKLAIPGVFCLATNNKGYLDWEAFVSGFPGTKDDTCCAKPIVQSVDLLKVSPRSDKCPIFGGYQVHQFGHENIRTWWPLAYTMPGTTFTLTLRGICKEGYQQKPYKEVYRWTVVANPDTFNQLIDLFHLNALGELEVPSIVGEEIYAALKLCAAKLKKAIEALKKDPKNAAKKLAACDAIIECEALILCNTLFLDHLDAPEQMTYPYHQAAPKRQLPGNRAVPDPNVHKGPKGSGGVIGIIDTDQNPVACKLIADLEAINKKYCSGHSGY